jgi:hypothetical protein
MGNVLVWFGPAAVFERKDGALSLVGLQLFDSYAPFLVLRSSSKQQQPSNNGFNCTRSNMAWLGGGSQQHLERILLLAGGVGGGQSGLGTGAGRARTLSEVER